MNYRQTMLEAFPAVEPTEEAKSAVLLRISGEIVRLRHRRRVRRTTFGLAATTSLVCAGFIIGPSALAVYRLKQIAGSVSDAKTAEFDTFAIESDGSLRKTGRTIYDRGRWRIERGDEYQIYDSGVLWMYQPRMHRVAKLRKADGPATYNPSGFSVSAMISDQARWGWNDKIEMGSETFKGTNVDKVTIAQPGDRERVTVLANPSNHMPLEFRLEQHSATGWITRGFMTPTFDQPIDPNLFSHNFPTGVKVVDLDEEARMWRVKLDKPLETMVVGNQRVEIRNVTVNPLGDVFILFTDGYTRVDEQAYANSMKSGAYLGRSHRAWFVKAQIEVADSIGTEYLKSSGTLQPHMGSVDERFVRGLVMPDGQLLEGEWFIPKVARPWRSRRITLKVEKSTSFYTLDFKEPNSGILPDWMPQMAIGPQSEGDVLSNERQTRRPELKAAGDWAAIETSLREDLADVEEKERNQGQTYAKGTLYYELYDALSHTGKRAEALSFLRLASQESLYPNQYPAKDIERALRKEGLYRQSQNP